MSATPTGSTVSVGGSMPPVIPSEVRSKGRQVADRLSSSGWASTDPEYTRSREYLECLAGPAVEPAHRFEG